MGNNSHQFLGYWGYGSQGELEEVLSKVIRRYLSDEKMALLNQNMNQAIASSLRALCARSATEPYLR